MGVDAITECQLARGERGQQDRVPHDRGRPGHHQPGELLRVLVGAGVLACGVDNVARDDRGVCPPRRQGVDAGERQPLLYLVRDLHPRGRGVELVDATWRCKPTLPANIADWIAEEARRQHPDCRADRQPGAGLRAGSVPAPRRRVGGGRVSRLRERLPDAVRHRHGEGPQPVPACAAPAAAGEGGPRRRS